MLSEDDDDYDDEEDDDDVDDVDELDGMVRLLSKFSHFFFLTSLLIVEEDSDEDQPPMRRGARRGGRGGRGGGPPAANVNPEECKQQWAVRSVSQSVRGQVDFPAVRVSILVGGATTTVPFPKIIPFFI
jgi:hypothetical protein